ncbi:PREDICTED: E3 SUMO-protein ligase RanBP2-like [Dinoponera quadriceps]|uniref:E3 SUMO-protein ligase RanBP2-like n=1 Tax=Dinoponera quadriceps TaxID=609295 RepID=A0A6P3X5R0_DINQU|nr:PREDICTED: E3 SUMO-protein ligase RanBP2-like [Dinoponera quadriceps]
MFHTKKDVDRHVQQVFSKLWNQNEKNLRSYNVAKLYYQVGDYESAKRYVSSYLEVRDNSASAHKLLGQAYEALGQKEAALNEYKTSLELEARQDDLVLKVCDLLTDTDVGMDANKIKYWIERADKHFPHHPVVFKLKEKLLTVDRPNGHNEDLEALIISELNARPNDVQLRVKLLKHYMSKHRYENAYEHAASVEATHSYRNSIVWYQTLCELLTKCKESIYSDWSFWVLLISSLERYAALSLKEQGNEIKKNVPEATQAVFNFDQNLYELKVKNFSKHHVFAEHMLTHMWGQLHLHLACLLLRKTKREQGSWSEAGRLCAPLLLTALQVTPIDPTATWTVHIKDPSKNLINLWHTEGSYRCSQAGHVLQDYAKDNTKKLMDKIDKFCTGKWRERVYQRIFVSRIHLDHIRKSYFCYHSVPHSPLRLCSQNELKHYDEVAERVWPASLHHQVWLGIQSRSHHSPSKDGSPQPHRHSHVFSDLQFSAYNVSQAAPDSLCQLDVDAFLNAAILCSSAIVEEQQLSSFLSPDRLPTLPADLTSTFCTCNQEKWWSAAYRMYSKQKDIEGDIGQLRHELQQGLEVVRCIGNHGLHPVLLVHLARIFQYRTKVLKEKDKEHGDISALEARAELYWSTAVPLLERLQNNQTIRMSASRLFNYQGKDMNNIELTNALEEGKLLLAQKFVRDKQYEQAIDALQALKCPDASFQQAQIYKLFADEIVNSMPRESLTSEMRSQHIIMLSKARNCYYLTLDRLRSPGMNPKHPLNSELGTHIADIENELKRIDPDLGRSDLSRNDCDGMSDESYSPAHSAVDQTVANTTLPNLTGHNILSTPQRNTQRAPKQSSTPCRPLHHDILDLSRNRTEARPSPERLDAQIRQIMHSRDNVVQELVEQMKGMTDHMKTLTEKMEGLMKEMVELRKDNQKQYQQQQQHQRVQQQVNMNANVEDDFYVLDNDEYADLNYANQSGQAASAISGNMFTPPHRHPYSSLMYPSATTFQGYYQGGLPGFSDPNAQAIQSLYPHMYSMPIYPNRSAKVPDNLLQQGYFASRLSDIMSIPATNPPPTLQMPLQKVVEPPPVKPPSEPSTATTVIKDAPVNKAPPVNVVITTSDTLPTTVPLVQPTLSVTIPPQYRLGGIVSTTITTTTESSSSSNAPHCYQISMPSQATIPTTVNLPPLLPTLTTTPAGMQTMQTADSHRSGLADKSGIYEPVESPNTSTEVEHDPIPDFVPVIPLPAEVKVTTGEEDEATLYCGRAKLFRFVDKEWKERGVGYVKLLRNIEGKVRLLMRRDQVLKICANHMLRPDMELTGMANNNKAWCWVANDFADEEVKLEKLCIKFKTAEEALAFKEAFDKARLGLAAASLPVSSGEKDAQKPQAKISLTAEAAPDKPKSGTTTLGGFSFTSKPIIQEVGDTTGESKKPDEAPKVSPFTGFYFTKPTTTGAVTSASTPSTGFVFATTATPVTTTPSDVTGSGAAPGASPIFTVHSANFDQNPSLNTLLRRPRMPAPGVAKVGSHHEREVRPQAESEQKLFDGQASLQCQNSDTKQWENKGTGSMKLLLDVKSGKLRLLMTDESNSRVIYGYGIPRDTSFTFKTGATVVNWTAPTDTKKERAKILLFHAATFSSTELAAQFYDLVSGCQQKLQKGCGPSEVAKEIEKKTSSEGQNHSADKSQLPLSELFKPPSGSWECNGCYTRNNASSVKCAACEAPSPSAAGNKTSGFSAAANSQPAKPPLSELFKPPAGSWSCPGCYIVNSGANIYCVACDQPKDPSQPPKPQQNVFRLGGSVATTAAPMTTFTFGIPKDAAKETTGPTTTTMITTTTTTTGFTFRMPKPEDKDANESVKIIPASPPQAKAEETAGSFVFGGVPAIAGTTLNSTPDSSPFTFGTPTKSYGFNFTARASSKSPGSAGGENSEDEVVESDDIHFSPIIPLPDKIEVKTGEENEAVIYSHRAKLFRFDSSVKEWKERGLGDIKLLRHKETGKLRLIMRRDHVLKLCLNHLLSADLEFTAKDEKTWLWNAADYSEGEIEYMQFACRFKTSEIAEGFKRAIDDAKKGAKPAAGGAEKLDKSMTKAVGSPTREIEILYEAKVTPEEKAAALKLQLPENFYAYKLKEDCPGCRGCRKPSIVLFPDAASTQSDKRRTAEEKKPANTVVGLKAGPGVIITSSSSSSAEAKGNEAAGQATIQSTVKNGFSFAMSSAATLKTTSTPTFATSSVFDGSAMSFGTADLKLFNDKRSTTFSFGMNPQFGANETAAEKTTSAPADKQNVPLLENMKICGPTSSTPSTQTGTSPVVTTGQTIFSQSTGTTTGSIFKAPVFTFDSGKNMFGGTDKFSNAKTPLFGTGGDGNSLSFANTFNTLKTSTAASTTSSVPKTSAGVTSTFATTGSSLFGLPPMQPSSKASDVTVAATTITTTTTVAATIMPVTTSAVAFAMSNQPNNTIFSASSITPFSKMAFGNSSTPLFDSAPTVTATPAANVFEAKPSDSGQKEEDINSFLPSNNMTFTALAANVAQTQAFKKDPNFSFAGAGSSVFGSKSAESLSSPRSAQDSSRSTREDSMRKDDNEEDEGGEDNEQEHDPYFEPIVPLPDTIEVKTGEEDEEKVFCQRAKLYRYDSATKEWKERGIGEMKVLHHPGYGSYRLLMRREQVYKIVCNFLITPDVTFRPLSLSQQAWMWAGMNHAQEESSIEQLAVKFKSPELAKQFKELIDKIQQELREKEEAQGDRCVNEEVGDDEPDRDVDEEEEEEDDEEEDEDDEEEEDEDDQEMVLIIEKRATVFARWPNETKWEIVGLGNLAIHYDSEIYAERIVLKLDDSQEYASNTIISMETVMQVEGKECIWSGIDYALVPPVRRVLRAVLSSMQAAQEMQKFFEEGLVSAKQAGVVEYHE